MEGTFFLLDRFFPQTAECFGFLAQKGSGTLSFGNEGSRKKEPFRAQEGRIGGLQHTGRHEDVMMVEPLEGTSWLDNRPN